MVYRPEIDDPFYGGERIPSLSWNNLPVESTFTVRILEEAKSLQSQEFGTNTLRYWNDDKARPMMCAVLNVEVLAGPHSVGEHRSIWARIPSNLFVALKKAQEDAGCKFLPDGMLHVRYVGEKQGENKAFHPTKQYIAKYEPPVQQTGPDPFVNGTPAPQIGAAPLPQGRPSPIAAQQATPLPRPASQAVPVKKW